MSGQAGSSKPSIKLKFSLGTNASAGPSTPKTPKSESSTLKAKEKAVSINSKKGKGKARQDSSSTALSPKSSLKLRLHATSSTVNGDQNAKQDSTPTKVVQDGIPVSKPKIRLKSSQRPSDDVVREKFPVKQPITPPIPSPQPENKQPDAGPSTPMPPPGHPISTPVTPSNPTNVAESIDNTPSSIGTPVPSGKSSAARNMTGTTISKSGQRITKHGRVIGRPRGSRTKPHPHFPARPKIPKLVKGGRPAYIPPSAIPPRLLSSTPTTPRTPLSNAPSHITARAPAIPRTPEQSHVKLEYIDAQDTPDSAFGAGDSSLDTPDVVPSPSARQGSTPLLEAEDEELDEQARITRAKLASKKKPLKELLQRVLVQLWKKDEYGLFGEPVDLETFPDYLGIIGGEEKMMDLGTMQQRTDSGEYQDFEAFLTDLQSLVTAAKTFNPEGSIPYIYANKILQLGERQVEKSRPLVATPRPSPDRERGSATPWSGQEGTVPPDFTEEFQELPPQWYIPEEMLQFPPNSPHALAVGWNLTGGRKMYSKRQIRGRERFIGKWRHWELDGTRDLSELEDPHEVFASHRSHDGLRAMIDWKGMRREGAWWEFELGGPTGIAPVAFTPFPRPAPLKKRQLDAFEWGVHPETEAELAFMTATRPDISPVEALSAHLDPKKPATKPHPIPASNFSNVYDDGKQLSTDWLREVVYGDISCEAYIKSVKKFVAGAINGSEKRISQSDEKVENADEVPLESHVIETYYEGGLQPEQASNVRTMLDEVRDLRQALSTEKPLSDRQNTILELSHQAYARHSMKYLTRNENYLDISALLTQPSDFSAPGMGTRGGVKPALEWTGNEIIRLSGNLNCTGISHLFNYDSEVKEENTGKRKRDDDVSISVKKAKLDSSDIQTSEEGDTNGDISQKKENDWDDALRQLRLELIALCKFYPLAALKKMSRAEAERLLPQNVRALMSKQ